VQRLDHFAQLLGVRWTVLKLSAAHTRWGSAKADGSIRLHWRLMQFAPTVVDYVVAHELAHLRHMDHSARFWQTVASVVPDYAALRARLKGERLPPW
jgi:predicted metal-dependent hydrolase